VMINGVVI